MLYLIILLAIAARFVPHMPNFAPITALAIFSAAYLPWKQSVGLTLIVRFVSDIFLGFFSWPLMLAVYFSHLVGVGFGVWIKKSVTSPLPSPISERVADQPAGALAKAGGRVRLGMWTKIILSSLGSSLIFFLATNFAFLYSNYPHNFSGIISAYINGLPFLRGTLIGDLAYTAALFGGYEFAKYLLCKKSNSKFLIPNLSSEVLTKGGVSAKEGS